MFYCEFCEMSNNTFFTEHPQTTASVTNWTVSLVWHLFIIQKQTFRLSYKIIFQLFSTGIFLELWSRGPSYNFTEQLLFLQLWMAASNHLIISAIKKIGRWKIKQQNIKSKEKLKQLGLWSFYLVSLNTWSVLYLVSSKSWMHYSIALKFSVVF